MLFHPNICEVPTYKNAIVIVIQKNMIVTRQIILPLPTKVLYKCGCFEGIFQKAKVARLLIY